MQSDHLLPAIQLVLEDTFHLSGWIIARAEGGQQKACYIARTAQRAAFLKFDENAPVAILGRLGELGVAPRLIRAGDIAGRTYILQECVVGAHPSWRWFAAHLPLLARVTRAYHQDHELQRLLLTTAAPLTYEAHLAAELDMLALQVSGLVPLLPQALADTLRGLLAELRAQAGLLSAVSLAPTHPAPNGANIFISPDDTTMTLVDWDGVQFSDPLRDASQWLGWYVPSGQWAIFFAEQGLQMDETTLTRVYWWSARASFANALWRLKAGYDYAVFLNDTRASLSRAIVPHQVFSE